MVRRRKQAHSPGDYYLDSVGRRRKLSAGAIANIQHEYADGEKVGVLADAYAVSTSLVRTIVYNTVRKMDIPKIAPGVHHVVPGESVRHRTQAPAGWRWVSCSKDVEPVSAEHRHLIATDKGTVTTVCGSTASHPEVWRGNSTKPVCSLCQHRALELGINLTST